MSVWDNAFSKVVTGTQGSGGGGSTTLTFTVPTGEVWEVFHGMAYHDDAARSCQWYALGQSVHSPKSLGTGIPYFLYEGYDASTEIANPWQGLLRLYAGQTVQFLGGGMAASKTLTGRLWVRFLRGINDAV